MSLAEITNDLKNARAVLEQHVPQLEQLAVIADDPAMRAMELALPVVPRAILDGITAMLNAVTAEHAARAAEPQAA